MGRAQFKKELGAFHEPVVGRASSLLSGHVARRDVWGAGSPAGRLEARPTSERRFMVAIRAISGVKATDETTW